MSATTKYYAMNNLQSYAVALDECAKWVVENLELQNYARQNCCRMANQYNNVYCRHAHVDQIPYNLEYAGLTCRKPLPIYLCEIYFIDSKNVSY